TAGELSLLGGGFCDGGSIPQDVVLRLELVPQCELHRAWTSQQSSVIAKAAGVGEGKTQALHIEPRQGQRIENFSTQLQAVRFLPGHLPALAEAEIQTSETVAAEVVALSNLAREISLESVERCIDSGGVPEQVYTAIRVFNRPCRFYWPNLGRKA